MTFVNWTLFFQLWCTQNLRGQRFVNIHPSQILSAYDIPATASLWPIWCMRGRSCLGVSDIVGGITRRSVLSLDFLSHNLQIQFNYYYSYHIQKFNSLKKKDQAWFIYVAIFKKIKHQPISLTTTTLLVIYEKGKLFVLFRVSVSKLQPAGQTKPFLFL